MLAVCNEPNFFVFANCQRVPFRTGRQNATKTCYRMKRRSEELASAAMYLVDEVQCGMYGCPLSGMHPTIYPNNPLISSSNGVSDLKMTSKT